MFLAIPMEWWIARWLVLRYPTIAVVVLQSGDYLQHKDHNRYANLLIGVVVGVTIAFVATNYPMLLVPMVAWEGRQITKTVATAYHRKHKWNLIKKMRKELLASSQGEVLASSQGEVGDLYA
jgi:hypothetical protein